MNFMQIVQYVSQFRNNPQQVLQRFGIPNECNSPDSVVEYLMKNGKVNQSQIDQAKNMYQQMFRR